MTVRAVLGREAVGAPGFLSASVFRGAAAQNSESATGGHSIEIKNQRRRKRRSKA